jgi:hypothetical protein
MTIKLRTLLCGPDGTFHPGEHSFDAARERELVKAGYAEFVGTPAKARARAETTRARPGETTALLPIERQAAPPTESPALDGLAEAADAGADASTTGSVTGSQE